MSLTLRTLQLHVCPKLPGAPKSVVILLGKHEAVSELALGRTDGKERTLWKQTESHVGASLQSGLDENGGSRLQLVASAELAGETRGFVRECAQQKRLALLQHLQLAVDDATGFVEVGQRAVPTGAGPTEPLGLFFAHASFGHRHPDQVGSALRVGFSRRTGRAYLCASVGKRTVGCRRAALSTRSPSSANCSARRLFPRRRPPAHRTAGGLSRRLRCWREGFLPFLSVRAAQGAHVGRRPSLRAGRSLGVFGAAESALAPRTPERPAGRLARPLLAEDVVGSGTDTEQFGLCARSSGSWEPGHGGAGRASCSHSRLFRESEHVLHQRPAENSGSKSSAVARRTDAGTSAASRVGTARPARPHSQQPDSLDFGRSVEGAASAVCAQPSCCPSGCRTRLQGVPRPGQRVGGPARTRRQSLLALRRTDGTPLVVRRPCAQRGRLGEPRVVGAVGAALADHCEQSVFVATLLPVRRRLGSLLLALLVWSYTQLRRTVFPSAQRTGRSLLRTDAFSQTGRRDAAPQELPHLPGQGRLPQLRHPLAGVLREVLRLQQQFPAAGRRAPHLYTRLRTGHARRQKDLRQ